MVFANYYYIIITINCPTFNTWFGWGRQLYRGRVFNYMHLLSRVLTKRSIITEDTVIILKVLATSRLRKDWTLHVVSPPKADQEFTAYDGEKCVAGISNHQWETVVFSFLDMECGDFWRVWNQWKWNQWWNQCFQFKSCHLSPIISPLKSRTMRKHRRLLMPRTIHLLLAYRILFFLNTTSYTSTNILEKSSTYQTICSLQYRAAQ